MIFTILRIFFWIFFRFNFDLNKIKMNKKGAKASGSHVSATWHARPRGRATRTRAAPTWHSILIIFLFNLYIKGLQPSPYGKGY